MKRTISAISVALLISVAFVTGVMAQSQPQQKPAPAATAPATLGKFSGAIEKIDGAKKEIWVKNGTGEKSFAWNDQTKFMQGDKVMPATDLKKGQEVTVAYKKEGAKMTAERVDVSMPKTSG